MQYKENKILIITTSLEFSNQRKSKKLEGMVNTRELIYDHLVVLVLEIDEAEPLKDNRKCRDFQMKRKPIISEHQIAQFGQCQLSDDMSNLVILGDTYDKTLNQINDFIQIYLGDEQDIQKEHFKYPHECDIVSFTIMKKNNLLIACDDNNNLLFRDAKDITKQPEDFEKFEQLIIDGKTHQHDVTCSHFGNHEHDEHNNGSQFILSLRENVQIIDEVNYVRIEKIEIWDTK